MDAISTNPSPSATGAVSTTSSLNLSTSAGAASTTPVPPKPQYLSGLVCFTVEEKPAPEVSPQNLMSEIRALLGELGELLKSLLKQLLPTPSAGMPAPSDTPTSGAAPSGTATTGSASGPSVTTAGASPETQSSAPVLNFSEKLKLVLEPDSEKRVSETELRRGIITFQLYQKSPKVADAFTASYEELAGDDTAVDLAMEKALINLVEEGQLNRTDANWIFSLSHRAAQLDSDTETVGTTSSGKEGFDIQGAIRCAEATLAGIQSGSIKVEQKAL